jgi:hypothetical protein
LKILENKRGSYTSENIIINCCRQDNLKNESIIVDGKTDDKKKRKSQYINSKQK